MRVRLLLLTFFSLFTLSFFHLKAEVFLNYPEGQIVSQQMEVNSSIVQEFPGTTLKVDLRQVMDWTLEILGDSGAIHTKGPLELSITLTRLQVELKANEFETSFDSQSPLKNPLFAQVHQLIGVPVTIKLGEDFTKTADIPELEALMTELPLLPSIVSPSLFEDLLEHTFALAGRDLMSKGSIQRGITLGRTAPITMPISYEVTSIDDQSVKATLHGALEKTEQVVALDEMVGQQEDEEDQYAGFALSGEASGEGSWLLDNALLCQLQLHHKYQADFTVGELTVPMKIEVHQIVNSNLKTD